VVLSLRLRRIVSQRKMRRVMRNQRTKWRNIRKGISPTTYQEVSSTITGQASARRRTGENSVSSRTTMRQQLVITPMILTLNTEILIPKP